MLWIIGCTWIWGAISRRIRSGHFNLEGCVALPTMGRPPKSKPYSPLGLQCAMCNGPDNSTSSISSLHFHHCSEWNCICSRCTQKKRIKCHEMSRQQQTLQNDGSPAENDAPDFLTTGLTSFFDRASYVLNYKHKMINENIGRILGKNRRSFASSGIDSNPNSIGPDFACELRIGYCSKI